MIAETTGDFVTPVLNQASRHTLEAIEKKRQKNEEAIPEENQKIEEEPYENKKKIDKNKKQTKKKKSIVKKKKKKEIEKVSDYTEVSSPEEMLQYAIPGDEKGNNNKNNNNNNSFSSKSIANKLNEIDIKYYDSLDPMTFQYAQGKTDQPAKALYYFGKGTFKGVLNGLGETGKGIYNLGKGAKHGIGFVAHNPKASIKEVINTCKGSCELMQTLGVKGSYQLVQEVAKQVGKEAAGLVKEFTNADINGSLNIMRKAVPKLFSNGIEDVVVRPYSKVKTFL